MGAKDVLVRLEGKVRGEGNLEGSVGGVEGDVGRKDVVCFKFEEERGKR